MNDMTPTREQRTAALEGMGCKRKRVEDARFTQGKGNYVDDLKLPGMLHGDFVRSPHAHARVKSINSEEALKVPGVLAVITAETLKTVNLAWMPTLAGDVQMVLADGKVLFQNQEVAFVFANDVTVTASYSHSEAEVTRSNIEWEVGRRLNDTPQDLASIWLAKGFQVADDMTLRAGLGGRYVGSTVSAGPTTSIRSPGNTLADAMLELQLPSWAFSLNITNLFDKEYFGPCRYFGDCFTGNPRSVLGTVSYRF